MILLSVLIGLISIGALLLAIHRRADNAREKEKKEATVTQLHQRVKHIEQQIANWQQYSDNTNITDELYQVALELLDRLSVLEPTQSFAATEQERLLELIEQQGKQQNSEKNVKLLDSNAAIRQMQNELRDIKRTLHQRCSNALQQEQRYTALCREIDTIITHIAVDTYIALAAKAIDQQQPLEANRTLELALQAIDKANSSDPHITKEAKAIQSLLQQLATPAADSAENAENAKQAELLRP
jgi:hypothetical protein